MCIAPSVRASQSRPAQFSVPIDQTANRRATMETALRQRRAGAAADIFTSPTGIPAAATMGGAG